jgi:hypothetical protein
MQRLATLVWEEITLRREDTREMIDRKIVTLILDILKDTLILTAPVMLGAIATFLIGR